MGAGRSKTENDTLWELVKRVGTLETLVSEIALRLKHSLRTRSYYTNQLKRLRVEKQGLLNYIRELETALRVQREDEKI